MSEIVATYLERKVKDYIDLAKSMDIKNSFLIEKNYENFINYTKYNQVSDKRVERVNSIYNDYKDWSALK